MKQEIVLFGSKEQCCACGACMNICPQNAIEMKVDEEGFLYPVIGENCIKCGRCKQVCYFQNWEIKKKSIEAFMAVANDEELLMKSTSGGIFATLAKAVIEEGGSVFGCALEIKKNSVVVEHIRVTKLDDLAKLQGSKYVQSSINYNYKSAKEDLDDGKKVLFSGTPCQIAGLKGFLGGQEYSNLMTVDLVCHGVPSQAMFEDYIKVMEQKYKWKIVDFKFRDKRNGWKHRATVVYEDRKGKLKEKTIYVGQSSYYKLFLQGDIDRYSCMECKYSNLYRPADLTLGDFWGGETEHPDYFKKNGGQLDANKGLSCVLVNTIKGKNILDEYGKEIILKKTCFESIQKHNMRLNNGKENSDIRKQIFEIYKSEGYWGLEEWYKKRVGIKRYLYEIMGYKPHDKKE